MGGICDLITSGAPLLHRTVPDFADAPLVASNAETLLHVASELAASADRAAARAEFRVPPVTPKPPPLVRAPPDNENVQMTDVPSDYQSDWYGDWDYSNRKRNSNRYRRSRSKRIPGFFLTAPLSNRWEGPDFAFGFLFDPVPLGIFGSPLGEGRARFFKKRQAKTCFFGAAPFRPYGINEREDSMFASEGDSL